MGEETPARTIWSHAQKVDRLTELCRELAKSGIRVEMSDARPALSVRLISRRFPGLTFWFGRYTRSWWALVRVPAGWRLVEATDTDQLTRAVLEARTWPWPRTAAVWTKGSANDGLRGPARTGEW